MAEERTQHMSDHLPHHRVYEHRDTLHTIVSTYLDLLDTALIRLRMAEQARDESAEAVGQLKATIHKLSCSEPDPLEEGTEMSSDAEKFNWQENAMFLEEQNTGLRGLLREAADLTMPGWSGPDTCSHDYCYGCEWPCRHEQLRRRIEEALNG